jgi:hypothetical protein
MVLHSPYVSNRFRIESCYHIHRCLHESQVRNGIHLSTLTVGSCVVAVVVLQPDPGGVSSLRLNIVPVHVPSGWPSVVDDGAFSCYVDRGRMGQNPVDMLLVVRVNHLWSWTPIHSHQQTASAVWSDGIHHMGHASMTTDMLLVILHPNDGGFLASLLYRHHKILPIWI